MSRKFFLQISEPTSCLHHLHPDLKKHLFISSFRTYEKYQCSLAPNVTAPLYSMHKINDKVRLCAFQDRQVNEHTNRQTNMLITILDTSSTGK